jgi:hypothetical protein
MKVRLIKPDGKIGFEGDFKTIPEAEERFKRLVSACLKDHWLGARVQCLDTGGRIVHERVISE